MFNRPICECAPDSDHFEYESQDEGSREGSEDGDDY